MQQDEAHCCSNASWETLAEHFKEPVFEELNELMKKYAARGTAFENVCICMLLSLTFKKQNILIYQTAQNQLFWNSSNKYIIFAVFSLLFHF